TRDAGNRAPRRWRRRATARYTPGSMPAGRASEIGKLAWAIGLWWRRAPRLGGRAVRLLERRGLGRDLHPCRGRQADPARPLPHAARVGPPPPAARTGGSARGVAAAARPGVRRADDVARVAARGPARGPRGRRGARPPAPGGR